ncbi:MAG TPA: hypothetical protein VNO32_02685, partial [Candidatus Acidoferrum sp.]|nr:hypothetical protein [Candidatus Acidoferrum sp.]
LDGHDGINSGALSIDPFGGSRWRLRRMRQYRTDQSAQRFVPAGDSGNRLPGKEYNLARRELRCRVAAASVA